VERTFVSEAVDSKTTLDKVEPGQEARIIRIRGAVAGLHRFVDMGLTRNAVVRVMGFAPLGDPMEIKVRGYNLSLRRREAGGIEVEVLSQ